MRGEAMRDSASWLPSALRSFILGTLLAAAWVIFGAVSAQASSLLPPVTDTISSDTASSDTASDTAAVERGPLAALAEPVAAVAAPLAPQVQAIAEPVVAPVDTALAPAAAPVTVVVEQVTSAVAPVTALASDAVTPVTQTVAEITAPVTDLAADVTVPVLAPVGSVAGDVAPALPGVVGDSAQPTAAGSTSQNSAPADGARSAADAAVAGIAPDAQLTLMRDFVPVQAAASDAGSTVVMTARTPAPVAPAKAPAGSGSLLRTGGDGGSGVAADVSAFQFSLTQISLKGVLNSSDELPGSVSLDHGFSPD